MVVCACSARAMLRKSSCKASGDTPCCSLDGGSGFGAVRPTSITTPSAKSRNATSSACRWDASAGPRATEAATNPVTNLSAPGCFICRNSHWTEAWSTWKKITLPGRRAHREPDFALKQIYDEAHLLKCGRHRCRSGYAPPSANIVTEEGSPARNGLDQTPDAPSCQTRKGTPAKMARTVEPFERGTVRSMRCPPARLFFVAEPLSFSPTVAVHVSPFDRNVIERMRLPVGAGAHPQASASSLYACSWSLAGTPGTKKVDPCAAATRLNLSSNRMLFRDRREVGSP